jgi:hypothetical protein
VRACVPADYLCLGPVPPLVFFAFLAVFLTADFAFFAFFFATKYPRISDARCSCSHNIQHEIQQIPLVHRPRRVAVRDHKYSAAMASFHQRRVEDAPPTLRRVLEHVERVLEGHDLNVVGTVAATAWCE